MPVNTTMVNAYNTTREAHTHTHTDYKNVLSIHPINGILLNTVRVPML